MIEVMDDNFPDSKYSLRKNRMTEVMDDNFPDSKYSLRKNRMTQLNCQTTFPIRNILSLNELND